MLTCNGTKQRALHEGLAVKINLGEFRDASHTQGRFIDIKKTNLRVNETGVDSVW